MTTSNCRRQLRVHSWNMKWIAEDPDCSLASPQMVDLRNGRNLVGYGRFQCISDGCEVYLYESP
ncbi:MAG: hypothetical protein AAGL66_01440 [Pseudomonadota bacterium]